MSNTTIDQREGHRAMVVRKVIFHAPAALVMLAFTVTAVGGLLAGNLGALIGLVIAGGLTVMLGHEAVAALRDLRSSTITTRGRVARAWTTSRAAMFGREHHVLVEGRVFEVHLTSEDAVRLGDTVEVVHWPHSNVLVSMHLIERGPAPGPG
ncbi:MAG: hypothetical protein EXR65_03490 [Dehalococcoidia bacterium]|nr:hypothetical protein [Dehalococcoidia bacterium]